MSLEQTDPQALIEAVQTVVRAVVGIKFAPDNLPGKLPTYPAVITYYAGGHYDTGPFGIAQSLHNIACDVVINKADMGRDMETLVKFIESIPAALTNDPWFGGLCETFSGVRYEFIPSGNWAGVEIIGYRFIIENIKLYPYGKQ
jgi:hypothetical protein